MLIGKNQYDPFSYGFLNRKKQREGARKKGGRKLLQQGPNEFLPYPPIPSIKGNAFFLKR